MGVELGARWNTVRDEFERWQGTTGQGFSCPSTRRNPGMVLRKAGTWSKLTLKMLFRLQGRKQVRAGAK